jgi:thiosulfate/3-mercaptopyruvate sulfurtransferase
MNTITVQQLNERLLSGEDLCLINVLPQKSFDKQHIPGSQSVSQYEDEFLDRLEYLVDDEATPVVVYCNSESCNASSQAESKLTLAGYTDVYELKGGLAAWREAGFRVDGA